MISSNSSSEATSEVGAIGVSNLALGLMRDFSKGVNLGDYNNTSSHEALLHWIRKVVQQILTLSESIACSGVIGSTKGWCW